jgi:hypothetical protein
MLSAAPAPRIGDGGEEREETAGVSGSHAMPLCGCLA